MRLMDGKVVVITGGNSGIGKETAIGLAREGARVIFTARDAAKGAAALPEILDRAGSSAVEVMHLDLASFVSVRAFASDLLGRTDRIDVLINNAGGILGTRKLTQDGFEMTFGVNHLGHFLLTKLLLGRLMASAPSRVVTVSSIAHRRVRRGLDFDDLQTERRYRPTLAYDRSKLANILFTRELARRLQGTGVTVNALHPGVVATGFARDGDMSKAAELVGTLVRPFFTKAPKGARTPIYLASAPEVAAVTGRYFVKRKPVPPSKAAQDDEAAGRLWEISEQLVAGVPSAT